VVDEAEGYAFLHSQARDEGPNALPRLVARARFLSRSASSSPYYANAWLSSTPPARTHGSC
jgi:hypothetical protein